MDISVEKTPGGMKVDGRELKKASAVVPLCSHVVTVGQRSKEELLLIW
jgi:hypothetical protein